MDPTFKLRWLPAVLLISLLLAHVSAQASPCSCSLPQALSVSQRMQFQQQCQTLARGAEALDLRINQFNAKCASVEEKSPLIAECENEEAKLNVEKAEHRTAVVAYQSDLERAINGLLANLDIKIAMTKKRLQSLPRGLDGFQAAADDWIKLGEKAREKARHSAKAAAISVFFVKLAEYPKKEIALDEASLRKIKDLRLKRVFMDDLYAEVFTTQHLDKIKTYEHGLETLETIYKIEQVKQADELKDREEVLTNILKGIEVINHNPEISLLIADGELVTDGVYGWLTYGEAKRRVNQLLDLRDDQLAALKSVTGLYERQIKAKKLLTDFLKCIGKNRVPQG